jgi:hypothetical protein
MSNRDPWTMPAWMEPARPHIVNTGGNPVEELMNDHDTEPFSNSIRYALITAVRSQVNLLNRLHVAGLLREPDPQVGRAVAGE